MPRAKSENTEQIVLRVPESWLDRAESLIVYFGRPGIIATRTDVLRIAMSTGLDSLERLRTRCTSTRSALLDAWEERDLLQAARRGDYKRVKVAESERDAAIARAERAEAVVEAARRSLVRFSGSELAEAIAAYDTAKGGVVAEVEVREPLRFCSQPGDFDFDSGEESARIFRSSSEGEENRKRAEVDSRCPTEDDEGRCIYPRGHKGGCDTENK